MNTPGWNSLSPKRRRLVKWIAGLLLFYIVAGFLIVPPIVRSVAQKQLAKQLGREVLIQKVKFNPLALSATVRGFLIKDTDGSAFVSWDEVYVNFQLSSFLGRPWVFKEISTSRPLLRVQMNRDGTFNFSDILARFSTNAPASPAEPSKPKPLAVRIDRLSVAGATLSLKREEQLAAAVPVEVPPPTAPAPAPGTNASDAILLLLQSVTNAVGLLQQSTNAIAATVSDVSVTNCAIHLEDLANPRPVRLSIDEILLVAKNFSNIPRTNLTAALSLRWNTNGTIKTDLNALLAPASVDLHLMLDKVELRPLDPYLDANLNVFILDSKLGMDGRVRLRAAGDALPEVGFAGDTWLDEFHTVDGVLGEGLLNWSSVRIAGIDATLNPAVVAIRQIAVTDAFARLVIETNRTINLLAALRMTSTNAPAEPEPEPPADAEKKPAAGNSVLSTNALADLPLKKLSVGSIVISNAHADFSDRSLTPNVHMAIEQINGSISGLSSDKQQQAVIDLHASVDKVGPVAITGVINPFSETQTNEIKISVTDVDLTPTSSYAGKFAGYRIAKGKLSMTLAYRLQGRNLSSQNLITLDQFTFGEKVDSPDATKLPVRLAIAVLKDRQGKIVLDVPIEGSLDDPTFKLNKVIVRTLMNIFTKVITSPFSVLGSLFGGMGEEIRYQDFSPGSAELEAGSKGKLDALTKALYERPGLQLEIAGNVDRISDRDALRARTLEKQLRTQKWLSLGRTERGTTTSEQVTVDAKERAALVKRLYAEALASGQLASASTNADGTPAPLPSLYQPGRMERGAADLLRKDTRPAGQSETKTSSITVSDPFEQALLNSLTISESEFQELAASRARAVREYLLQSGQVEAERLFLIENQTSGTMTNGSRVYLQLQ